MTPLPLRFLAKVNIHVDGCWLWTVPLSDRGYGRFWVTDGNVAAHRFAYELLVGPIPEGLELDHTCRNRACVSPEHLEPVTHRENVLRGSSFAAKSARATHCKNGHVFDEANTIRPATGRHVGTRRCRACKRESTRRARASADRLAS